MTKRYEIDPLTGLRLEIVEPSPSPQQAIMTNLESAPPPMAPPETPMVIQPFNEQTAALTRPAVQPGGEGTSFGRSVLDKVIFAAFGTPDSKLEQGGETEEVKARRARRRDASAMSKNAAESPGDAFMEIPTASSGKSLGHSLEGPLQFAAGAVSKLFGLGKGSGVG